MLKAHVVRQASAFAAALALASCSSGSITPPSPPNMSGNYTGTWQDGQSGAGTATANFAQSGSNAGGTITIAFASATLSAQTSFTVSPSYAVSGAIVIDYPSGTTCSFKTTGTFNPNTSVLSGSYTAVTNCAGDTGTYSLTQQCTATAMSADRRTAQSLPPRC